MSRELIIEHSGTMLWSCTTQFPLGNAWYKTLEDNEQTIDNGVLCTVERWLDNHIITTQHTIDRLRAKVALTTLTEHTFDECWEALEEAEHALSMLNSSKMMVGVLREMVETIAATDGTPLTYIKSY